MANINQKIAQELGVRDGAGRGCGRSARRRRNRPLRRALPQGATGSLDDAQLRTLEERLRYLRELEERRQVILNRFASKASSMRRSKAIRAADSKGRLEDIYLPFKPKRRTKAEIAKEAGLEPLADLLLADPHQRAEAAAAASSTPTRTSRTRRPRSTARAPFWSSALPRTPT